MRILEDQTQQASQEPELEAATEAEKTAMEIDASKYVDLPKSVVGRKYKLRYKERAQEAKFPKGTDKRAMARSCGDWLALTLAGMVLDGKRKLIVPKLEAILEANGIAHAHWNRTTPGWEGRLRMTGGLALRTAVAREEQLFLPEGEPMVPPRAWVQKYQR